MKTNTEKKFEAARVIAQRHKEAKEIIEKSLSEIFSDSADKVKGNHEEKLSSLKDELNALLLD